jgi:enterobactin synthetase component D
VRESAPILRPDASGTPEAVWPWDDDPAECRLVASPVVPEAAPWPQDGIVVPPDLAGAVPRRRAEYLAGRRCAREALRLLTGRPETPGRGGDRAPLWPKGVVGSITHCGTLAVALAGPAHRYLGLGVDLEAVFEAEDAAKLAPLIMTEGERRRWGAIPDPVVATLTFCTKESLFKALYPVIRRRFYFDAAELLDWDPRGSARLRLCADLGGRWTPGTVMEARHCRFRGHMLTRATLPDGAPTEARRRIASKVIDIATQSH